MYRHIRDREVLLKGTQQGCLIVGLLGANNNKYENVVV